jgi:hypothetical protein
MTAFEGHMTGKNNKYPPHARDAESGVSEVVGAILLISVVVIAVSVIAVVLFSQQTPQKIPNVNLMVGIDNNVPPTLYLYHNGGDALTLGEFDVYVDGVIKPYSISGGGNEWSLGKNLVVPVSTVPKNVVLVYNSSGTGSVVLRSASVNVSTNTGSINPYNMSFPTHLGTDDEILDAFMANVTGNYISFYKNSLASTGGLKSGSRISLRITDTEDKSWIVYNGNLIPLNNTDVITIDIPDKIEYFTTFGIASQIWELSANIVDLTITRAPPVSTIVAPKAVISHTWIQRYELVTSTLDIDTAGISVTALMINNTRYLPPPSTNASAITITGAKPLPVGLFVLTIDKSHTTAYFVGTANTICIDTNCGPFGL